MDQISTSQRAIPDLEQTSAALVKEQSQTWNRSVQHFSEDYSRSEEDQHNTGQKAIADHSTAMVRCSTDLRTISLHALQLTIKKDDVVFICQFK